MKIWNGRGRGQRTDNHLYIAADSKADAARMLVEAHGGWPGINHWLRELMDYFSAGCWGNRMEGIRVERGIWETNGFPEGKPKRIYPARARKAK